MAAKPNPPSPNGSKTKMSLLTVSWTLLNDRAYCMTPTVSPDSYMGMLTTRALPFVPCTVAATNSSSLRVF